ncbi:hypothetical protein EWM64_g2160 [Hericium alpestre]|uniref:rRNA adenine N(6)-methyltransferase n=1 Tax=Hericium alpestre TaxID=135208 RepID=A0A4Z0A499_9AGAM|nr:hypothetical protein EWM64_g2160 [Hericium alpestre]
MKIASSFLQSKHMKSNKPKVVIEAFPACNGAKAQEHSREHSSLFPRMFSPLEQADSRVKVVPRSGFNWDTYGYLEENGLLDDVEISPWEDQAHPQLHFISHIPQNIPGEQLVAQLFRNIPEKTWLFKYGRVPMSFIMSDWVWRRVSAERSDKERCKLSVIAEATSLFHVSLDPDLVSPFADHFHPVPVTSSAQNRRTENRRLGTLTLPVNVTPLADQVIERGHLDTWDYVLRRLFVLKSTPLKGAISSLAPGAEILLKTITDRNLPREQRVDIGKQVRKLDIADWALLVRAFETWPFAPEDLTIDSFQSND